MFESSILGYSHRKETLCSTFEQSRKIHVSVAGIAARHCRPLLILGSLSRKMVNKYWNWECCFLENHFWEALNDTSTILLCLWMRWYVTRFPSCHLLIWNVNIGKGSLDARPLIRLLYRRGSWWIRVSKNPNEGVRNLTMQISSYQSFCEAQSSQVGKVTEKLVFAL